MEENERKLYLFEKAPISKAVLALCIPTILSSLVMVIYGLADTYFVGMLNDPLQNAGVTLASPVMMLYNAVTALFGVGASSLMSRSLGKRDFKTVVQCSATGLYLAMFSGVCFSVAFLFFKHPILVMLGAEISTAVYAADYLKWTVALGAVPAILNVAMAYMIRSEGASLHASVGAMSGCFLNMLLDPFFILPQGLNMGVAGAGCATFLSNCFACLYFFILLCLRRKNTYVCLDPRKITLKKELILGILNVGIPAMIANFFTVAGQIILNNFTATYGTNAIAAMGIAFRVDLVPANICSGLSAGIMPVIGYNYASGNFKRMKKALKFTLKWAVSFITIVTVLYLCFAEIPISWFISNQEIIELGAIFLKGLCAGLPFYCVDFVASGVFQACGLGAYSLIFTIFRNVVLQFPFLFILGRLFGVFGLPYAYFLTEFVLAVAAGVVLFRLFKKWEVRQSLSQDQSQGEKLNFTSDPLSED